MARPGTLAIDVGGTFTDITYADAETGATWVAKTPSTPADLSRGFITAVRKVLGQAGRTPPDVLRVFHGTTTATIDGESLVVGGDIILSVEGIEVTKNNLTRVRDALNKLRSGQPFKATVLRAGRVVELTGRAP